MELFPLVTAEFYVVHPGQAPLEFSVLRLARGMFERVVDFL